MGWALGPAECAPRRGFAGGAPKAEGSPRTRRVAKSCRVSGARRRTRRRGRDDEGRRPLSGRALQALALLVALPEPAASARDLALHPSAVAVQRDVVALREVDPSLLHHGRRVEDDAEVVARDLVADVADQNAGVFDVAVGLGHEDRLPGQLAARVLAGPLDHLVGVVVLLGQAQHAVVVDDAPAVAVPHCVELRVDLRLVEAVVRPAGIGALASRQVQAEPANLAAAAPPAVHVAGARLLQREAHGRLVVADDVQEDAVVRAAGAALLLEGVDDVEEEEGVGLEGLHLLAGLLVDEPDQGRAVRLPGVVVVQVALVLAGQQPLALRAHHAVPVQRVRDLDHDHVLLGQRGGVDGRGVVGQDGRDGAALHRSARGRVLVGRDREDGVLGLQAHVLLADLQVHGDGVPLACFVVHVRLRVEDHNVLGHLVLKRHLAAGLKTLQLELHQRGADRHGDAARAARKLRDVQVAVLVVRGREEVGKAVEGVREAWPGAGLAHGDAPGLAVLAVVPGVQPLVLVLALAVALDLHAVEHGLAVHPVDELVLAELELGGGGVDPAAAQPRGDGSLHAESVHLDLLRRGLQPGGEVDADLVRPVGAIQRVHVRD
mmetsp:Transcript_73625/g.193150  ORF Transcript_73625/g.193150 Transcript_73625/m.193150 type:complete len:605 (-) Transcript_73625:160-1974(-)